MSTLKSSAEDLTLNADGSGNDIIFQSNGSNVATLDQAGLLTATTFAGSGASLTALNATNLGSGTVPTARLGSGTASSSTVLYGDQTYKAEPTGGKVLQVVHASYGTQVTSTSSTFADTGLTASITPASTSNKILVSYTLSGVLKPANNTNIGLKLLRGASSIWQPEQWTLHTADGTQQRGSFSGVWLDSPSSTSSTTYKIQFANSENVDTVTVQNDAATTTSSMVLMEIAG